MNWNKEFGKTKYLNFEKLGKVVSKKFNESKSSFDNYFYKLLSSAKYENDKLFAEIILRFIYLVSNDSKYLKKEDVLLELNDVILNKNYNIAFVSFMKGFYSR